MEILEQTLRELESRERNQHNLETTYVKDLLPGFRDEFKSFGIQDLDNYGTYSLQNILDDLRHIQMLLDGSPTIKKFQDKKEFLLELSRKMLRKVQKVVNVPEVQSEKEIRSTEAIKDPKEKEGGKKEQEIQLPIIRRKKPVKINKNTEFQMTKTQDKVAEAISDQQPAQEEMPQVKSQEIVEAKVDSPSLIKLKVVPKKKDEPAKEDKKQGNITIEEMEPSEIKEDKSEVKEEYEAKEVKEKPNKEVRVKKIHKSHKSSKEEGKRKKQEAVEGQEKLSQIAEEVDGSDNETTETNDTESRRVKKKWQLTEDQEKQIQEMSAQYGVEVDALRGYLESKAAQHHFNWLGIKRLETKVDMNLEIKKLESEYERFVQRKSYFRADYPYKNKMSSSQMLPAVYSRGGKRHSDQFAIIDSADKSISRAASNSGFRSAAEKFQFDLKDLPSTKRKSMMTHSQSLPNSREKPSRGEEGPSSDEYWSTVSFVKSKGQIKLPSITSFNPYSKKAIPSQTTINFDFDEDFSKRTELNSLTGIHHLTNAELYNVLVSPTFKGRNSQKFFNTPVNGRQLPAVPILADHFSFNKIDTRASLDDSLAMEIENKDRRGASNGFTGLKLQRKFSSNDKTPVSQIHTSRSKYIHSSQSAYKSNAESLTFDDLPPLNMKGVKSDSNQTEQEFKAKGELLRMDSELGSISRGDSNGNREESMGIGTTLQTISTKSVVSVYTQEAPSRFMSLASFNSGMRIVEGELEYYGTINRTQLLGIGSEAKVYLCHMKEYENDVALKQYKGMKKGPESMQVYDTIKDEFMMLRRLEHENIIKYHCLYRSNRKNNLLEFGVIMEYMPGGSLEDYIKKEYGSIPFTQKKMLMKQILEGLNYLHKNDIIHRDLKPENILLSQDKTVAKITDFGISTQNKHDMNIERSVVGTPWYMAPEIIKLEAYSAKADIWSAGCCFYQLILGQKPYHQESAAIAMERMAKSLTPLQDNIDEIVTHNGLKEILELCFTRDKDSRPTAEELLQNPFFSED